MTTNSKSPNPAPGSTPGSTPAFEPIPRSVRPRLLIFFFVVAIGALYMGSVFNEPIQKSVAWLKPGSDHSEHTNQEDSSDGVTYYTCGMHPWVVLPLPGDCPICHMKLTPLDPKKFSGEVSIDPLVVQNIGVRIQPVQTGPLVKTIRTVGSVTYNERLVRDINTKVSGWIEKLHVDFVGARVQTGDSLFEIYSPDLYAAQEEYLIAMASRQSSQTADDLVEAARTRLAFFDITDAQIAALEKEGKPSKTMAIRSPYQGVVIAKHANEGMKISSGMRVYRIADLSRVWVIVTLYEYQLPYVKVGQKAVMTLPYIPGQTFEGEIIYIYPYLDPKTREVQVRLEFDNLNGLLKPGMFTNIELHNRLAEERVLAPRSAIIDTGERQVAFVSLGEGKFEPRHVRMGVQTNDGKVEILEGLKPGEQVVTSGQFLIDSEANIREALAKMIKGDSAAEQTVAVAVEGASGLSTLPSALASALTEALNAYFLIGNQLADDTADKVASPARTLAGAVNAMLKVSIPDQPHFWHKNEQVATVRGKALELLEAGDLVKARAAFADLSVALISLVKATGVPPSYGQPVTQLHCPMFQEGQGGSTWLQNDAKVRNPYFGSMMLGCFDKRVTMPVTGEGGGGTQ